jgi:hypothetical protein
MQLIVPKIKSFLECLEHTYLPQLTQRLEQREQIFLPQISHPLTRHFLQYSPRQSSH